MPYVSHIEKDKLKTVRLFSNNLPNCGWYTRVHDYFNIVDLVEDYVALENLTENIYAYNLGIGKGTSVLEKVFEKANDIEVHNETVDRRSGDITSC
jgi:UDP-glucose 4-epimerase